MSGPCAGAGLMAFGAEENTAFRRSGVKLGAGGGVGASKTEHNKNQKQVFYKTVLQSVKVLGVPLTASADI